MMRFSLEYLVASEVTFGEYILAPDLAFAVVESAIEDDLDNITKHMDENLVHATVMRCERYILALNIW